MGGEDALIGVARELLAHGRYQGAADTLALCLERDPARPEVYWLLADALRGMGNEEMAARMAAAGSDLARDAHPGAAFTFLVVPGTHCGTRFLKNAVALHPQLACPELPEVDDAIAAGSLEALLARHAPAMDACPNIRHGLVLHDFSAWDPTRNSEATAAIPRMLAEVTRAKGFIHCVRDPHDYAKAVLAHLVGGYRGWSFERSGLPWFSVQDPSDTSARDGILRHDGPAVLEDPAGVWRAEAPHITALLRFDALARRFQEHFPRHHVLDISMFRPDGDGWARLFGLLGVNPTFRHPTYALKANSRIGFFMQNNMLGLDVCGQVLPVRLGRDGDALGMTRAGERLVEVARLDRAAVDPALGMDESGLVLLTRAQDWDSLNPKARIRLVEGGLLAAFLEHQLVPCFARNFAKVQEAYAALDEAILDGDMRRALWRDAGDEIETFSRLYPEIAGLWRDPGEAFS